MKTIKDILSQFGFVTKPQLQELAEYFPETKLVIRWGGMPRERVPADKVADRIKQVEDDDIDYVRDVFIDAQTCDLLTKAFSIEK